MDDWCLLIELLALGLVTFLLLAHKNFKKIYANSIEIGFIGTTWVLLSTMPSNSDQQQ